LDHRLLFIQEATHLVAASNIPKPWPLLTASLHALRTARMKMTPGRRSNRTRNIALKYDPISCPSGIGNGNGRKKGLSIRMFRLGVELAVGAGFYDLSQVHDRNVVADIFHDGKIVGNDDVGKLKLLLQVDEQIDDLGLNGDVKGGDRLIAYDDLGIEGQCPRDPDPLSLPARKLVRIPPPVFG
jgi:hypothetical protein